MIEYLAPYDEVAVSIVGRSLLVRLSLVKEAGRVATDRPSGEFRIQIRDAAVDVALQNRLVHDLDDPVATVFDRLPCLAQKSRLPKQRPRKRVEIAQLASPVGLSVRRLGAAAAHVSPSLALPYLGGLNGLFGRSVPLV